MSLGSDFRRSAARITRILGSFLALALFIFLAVSTISGYLLYQILNPPRSPANLDVSLLMGHPMKYSFDIPGEGSRQGWFFPGLLHGPTVVLCHGYGSQRADVLTLETALQEHGFNVYLFDFIGHGTVPGRTTLGFEETNELLAAIQGLEKRQDIDTTRFGVWGTDMGAYAALAAAERDPQIRAVAVESVYNQPADYFLVQVGQSGLGTLPLVKPFCLFGFRMINRQFKLTPPLASQLPRLDGVAKLFIESTDKPALATSTMKLFQIASPPKQELTEPLTYAEMSDEGRRQYENQIVSFFLLYLPSAGQSPQ